ncbi:MAG: tetratricopeptide repeat protein [Bryobacteraceae bacterium]
MKRPGAWLLALGAVVLLALSAAQPPQPIAIDYPEDGSIFPPEFPPPTFQWRDTSEGADRWRIEVRFGDNSAAILAESQGERLRIGEIDPRAVADTNELPKLSPEQAAARTWTPGEGTWAEIKRHSVTSPATVTVSGFRSGDPNQVISRGSVRIQTSTDPVGAPIFYRDVPLMPSELEKGVIKPLAAAAVPLIAWRLRNVGQTQSRLLMTGLHTCANCHSFSRDGKTLGMDMDGPQNDKGLYALASIRPQMSIGNQDMIAWSSFRGKLTGDLRIGFMSQVSPDGAYVVTTIKGPQPEQSPRTAAASNYYVANFKDYRFLQVFYPTYGILAWYSRETGVLQPLPGADDPRYVHTNAVWSPDGKYLVFARAEAKAPYPAGVKMAEYANDPNETQIRYDLYRIPFNGGKGGKAEPIQGASANGRSNSFPKVSPDGRWIVFVQARNGLLMRPDGQLYIIPSGGGEARRMRANTPLMNSWHSFSPNGRWMVFSSKSRSPYTQMFLTHLDEQGNSSPAVLIENSTASNRAVNIPEFVNIPPDGLMKIDTPAVEYYTIFDSAIELARKGQYEAAVAEWKRALALTSDDARAYMNLGFALSRTGRNPEAIAEYQKALKLNPDYAEAHNNYGIALADAGRLNEAIAQYREALRINPGFAEARNGLGLALLAAGKATEAVAEYRKALEIRPDYPEVHNNLGIALAGSGNLDEAITHYRKALERNPDYPEAHNNLGLALARSGKLSEAIPHFEKFAAAHPDSADVQENLALALAGTGNLPGAISHFQKVVELRPGSAEARSNLGLALAEAGKPAEAIVNFQKAVALDPKFAEARYHLGNTLYFSQGRVREALAEWREVLRLEPNQVQVLDLVARVLAADPGVGVRNGAEAVALAERAVKLTGGKEPAVLDTLGAAYAEAGRFPEAVRAVRAAMAIAVQLKQQPLAEALKSRIALYEARTPLRGRLSPPAH